jgi:hypothetical protein
MNAVEFQGVSATSFILGGRDAHHNDSEYIGGRNMHPEPGQFAAPPGGATRACFAFPSVRESRIPKAAFRSGRSAMYVPREAHRQDRPARTKQVVAKETQAAPAAPDRSNPCRPGPGGGSRTQGCHRAARHPVSGACGGGAGPRMAAAGTGSRFPAAPTQAPTLIPRESPCEDWRGFTRSGGRVDTTPTPPYRSEMSPSWEPPAGAPRREAGYRSDVRQQRRCGCA